MAQAPIDKPSLTERVRRAAAGDRAAWDDLLDEHRGRLRRMVALRLDRRLQGRLDPSDVIQEAFLDATAGLSNFVARQEMPFFLWLRWLTGLRLTTLHRQHLGRRIRDAAREVSLERAAMPDASSAALAAHLLGRDTSASAVAIRLERKACIQEAIDALEPFDREVLILRHFEELTNAEVAHLLEIQESAASKRYVRALRRLKEALSAMPGGSVEFRP
jgi:RNA polymerase sigma-70 factor, ECF subfamily